MQSIVAVSALRRQPVLTRITYGCSEIQEDARQQRKHIYVEHGRRKAQRDIPGLQEQLARARQLRIIESAGSQFEDLVATTDVMWARPLFVC